jgi:hypothetical protein
MKIKFTKRDVGFFFLVVFAMFLFELVYDWQGTVNAFKEGYNETVKEERLKLE